MQEGVRVLQRDGLVIYPTETVYGLGADAFSDDAILKVFEAKHRPLSQPISVAVSDIEMLMCIAYVSPADEEFIARFLPGPVTVVLKAKRLLPATLTAGTGLIGIRIPAHPVPIALIEGMDSPITATSANVHGAPEPRTPGDCRIMHDYLIDGGSLPGQPSTVVDLTERRILRRGADVDQIESYLSSGR